MTYKNKLLPWCIVRSFPDACEAKVSPRESQLIICFRRRSDAKSHLQILRSNNPTASYEIIFDVTSEMSDLYAQQEAFSYSSYREYRD